MVDRIPAELEGRMVPYLIVDGASDAIEFYRRAFDAEERVRMPMPDGRLGHAEIVIGGAYVYLADPPEPQPGYPQSPRALGGTTMLLHRYVEDVDAAVEQARSAGASVVRPPQDEFYGDRAAVVEDPWGHLWSIHTHVRDVTVEEMERAMPSTSPSTSTVSAPRHGALCAVRSGRRE
jgi:PhnB protein